MIGIDLGTTNCALAYTQGESVQLFDIPQLVNPGEERAELHEVCTVVPAQLHIPPLPRTPVADLSFESALPIIAWRESPKRAHIAGQHMFG